MDDAERAVELVAEAIDQASCRCTDPLIGCPYCAALEVVARFTVGHRVNDDGYASSMCGPDGRVRSHGRPSSRSLVLTEIRRSA